MTPPVKRFGQVPPHAVRDAVLSKDELADLLAFTLAHEADFVPAELGRVVDATFRTARVLPRRWFEPWHARIEAHTTTLLP